MAIYHLSAKVGKRSGGQSAGAKARYVSRQGDYERKGEAAPHVVSENMPAWVAGDDPAAAKFWDAADLHERANAKLFYEVEFALPRELSLEDRRTLALDFARDIARRPDDVNGALPFTLAMHDENGNNPHCHAVFCERANDGIDRGPEPASYFKQANKKDPERGGAAKTRTLQPKEWLLETRRRWQEFANAALDKANIAERIDHRTLAAQGIERAPQEHLGPKAKGFEARTGRKSNRRFNIEERRRIANAKRVRARTINSSPAGEPMNAEEQKRRAEVSREARQRVERAQQQPAKPSPAPTGTAVRTKPMRQQQTRKKLAPAATSRLAQALRASQVIPPGVARWAIDSIKDLERIANALKQWSARLAEDAQQKLRPAPSPSPAPAGASRPPVAPAARQKAATRREVASALAELRPASPSPNPNAPPPAGQRPASAGQDSSGDDRRQRLERQMNRALETGKSKSLGLAAAAELGDRKAVDKLIENGAAVLPDSLDAAAKRGDDDMFKKLVGYDGSATDAVSLRELAAKCSSPEARQKLDALAAQAKAQGGHTAGLGIDGPSAPSTTGPKAGAGMAGPK